MADYNNVKTYKKYIFHNFLYKFTESLFFVFGALLLYTKTESIIAVLIFGLITKLTSLLFRTVGLGIYFHIVKRVGILTVLGMGAVLMALAYSGIFYIDSSLKYFYYLLYGLAFIQSIGNALFINISNALMFESIGLSRVPGGYSAGVTITNTFASLFAAFTGLLLSIYYNFLFSFIIGAMFLVLSIIPLKGIKLPKIKRLSFSKCIKKISFPGILANINPEHGLKVTALPLIIMLLFTSIRTSIVISTIVAIGTIALSQLAGKYKDANKKNLGVMALIIYILIWVFYGFVFSKLHFIILGIVGGFADTILNVGREARLGREISNSKVPLEATVGVEIARTLGLLISYIILIVFYIKFKTIPQLILILGALFIIPKGLYALGKITPKLKNLGITACKRYQKVG